MGSCSYIPCGTYDDDRRADSGECVARASGEASAVGGAKDTDSTALTAESEYGGGYGDVVSSSNTYLAGGGSSMDSAVSYGLRYSDSFIKEEESSGECGSFGAGTGHDGERVVVRDSGTYRARRRTYRRKDMA